MHDCHQFLLQLSGITPLLSKELNIYVTATQLTCSTDVKPKLTWITLCFKTVHFMELSDDSSFFFF